MLYRMCDNSVSEYGSLLYFILFMGQHFAYKMIPQLCPKEINSSNY